MALTQDMLAQLRPESTLAEKLYIVPANSLVTFQTLFVSNTTSDVAYASWYHSKDDWVFDDDTILKKRLELNGFEADKIPLEITTGTTGTFGVLSHTASAVNFTLYGWRDFT